MSEHPVCAKKRRRVTAVGWSALGVGVFAIPVPVIPGTIFMMVGLSLLSLESHFAHRQLARVREKYPICVRSFERLEAWTQRVFGLTTHTHKKVTIPLRDQSVASGEVAVSEISGMPVAIVLHGASETKDSEVTSVIAASLKKRGYTVVRFNAQNSIGEGVGGRTSFTARGYRNNLTDVHAWVRSQPWWSGSLVLAGHSFGGLIAGLYAEDFPADVSELVLVAPTISGEHVHAMCDTRTLSGVGCQLGNVCMEDAVHYSLLDKARDLSMKVTILSGTKDEVSTPHMCELLADTIGGAHVEIVSMDNVSHVPHTTFELRCLKMALS